LPDITEIMASDGGILDSQEIFSEKGAKLVRERIDDHLVKDVITLRPKDKVLKAAAMMVMKKMRRLPVVKDGKLLGTISRSIICKAVMGK
jgi:predicted transcriptional regulator